MSRKPAIDLAIEALGRPGLASLMAAGPLPDGIKSLLRIAADGECRDGSTERAYRQHAPEAVRGACVAFLSTVLFQAKSDPYRVLGLPTGASEAEVTEHKRFLLKWLHPDRNANPAEQQFLQRVLDAAAAIEGKSAAPRIPPRHPDAAAKPALAPSPRRNSRAKVRSADATGSPGRRKLATQALRTAGNSLRLSAYAAAAVVAALVAWRYVMSEPIGVSLERYSEAALGFMKW